MKVLANDGIAASGKLHWKMKVLLVVTETVAHQKLNRCDKQRKLRSTS